MTRTVVLALVLAAVWFLLSGHTEPMILGFGAASVAFTAWLAHRLDIDDDEGVPTAIHTPRAIPYVAWLVWQVIVSNLDVARRIWSPTLDIAPRVIAVEPSQKTTIGRVLYANSITLTPGTVSIRMYDGEIVVHALHQGTADDVLGGAMDRRVTALERSP